MMIKYWEIHNPDGQEIINKTERDFNPDEDIGPKENAEGSPE